MSRENVRLDFVWPWADSPPLMAWQAHGLLCASAPGMLSINGYVRVPDDHPVHGLHYNEINEVVEVHGGLTYGCDQLGWMGFDTAHAFDYWSDEELAKAKFEPRPGEEKLREILTRSGLRPVGDAMATDYDLHWTIELLQQEVNDLARQLAALRA